MTALLAALALFAAQAQTEPAAAPPAAETGAPYPVGAPRDDYRLVSWCYGALRGWLDLHEQVMPEVRRIETTWRRPGAKLADDLKVYDDMQREGRRNLTIFEQSIEAAEKASIRPISALGAEAVKKGRMTWAAAPNLQPARLAQEWMSWALPARCLSAADELRARAKLMGQAFEVNAEPASQPELAPQSQPEAAPVAAAPQAQQP